MGEKLDKLGVISLNLHNYDVEINKGVRDEKNIVHFQTSKSRFELSEKNFIILALAIIEAEQLLSNKKNDYI
jgi:hypothetical protein